MNYSFSEIREMVNKLRAMSSLSANTGKPADLMISRELKQAADMLEVLGMRGA